jgi:C4-dicarboxylate-specific signal transduction histidine kinase
MNREHLEHDIFLLMLNLTQLKDSNRILKVFIEAINSLESGIHVRFEKNDDSSACEQPIPIATMHNNFGYLFVEGDVTALFADSLPILNNAVCMLAVILENALRADLLTKERNHLESVVQQRTEELIEANNNLLKEIEKRKSAERELRQAQKMEAIGTFAGGIAHDFNNILAVIIGYADMVATELKPGSKVLANQHQVLKATDRATDLVKQILLFSRQSTEKRVPLKMHLTVKDAKNL